MPLSDDQKAMLRLLARDQSYEDIAALMGLSVDEVVARAQGAVAQLESEGIPAPALPQASGSASPPPAEEPKPAPASEPKPTPAAAPPPPPKDSAPKKPRDKGMLLAIGGGVLAVVVIVVLAVLLISNSGGDDSSSASGGDGTAVAENPGQARKPTEAKLVAVDGSDASGTATFGRVGETLGLGIRAQGMERAPKGSIYMVWLAQSPQKMLPLTAVEVKAGRINASYQVPTEAVVYLASGEFDDLVITLASNKSLRTSLEQANRDKDFPTYTGDAVLEGQVVGPIIGAAKRLEERQK